MKPITLLLLLIVGSSIILKNDFTLGVTATPQRSDNTRLTDVFDEIVYYKTIVDLDSRRLAC
jgi:superfamily II DNA or RNA helicase